LLKSLGANISEIQLYAAAGYIVFYPNSRGSTSYGEEFGDLLYNNYPGDDYQDVMDGVDALIESGLASEEQYPGQPWENIEGYMKFSPISLVGNVETPTLVMVGTADMRTPISEAKQLYNALKIRDIDTALVEVPGAPHNIAGRPSQLITKIDHILAWFEKYPPIEF